MICPPIAAACKIVCKENEHFCKYMSNVLNLNFEGSGPSSADG